METLDYDHNIHNAAQSDADRNLAVRFFTMPLKNETKSETEGRPIFDDTEMIEIRVRGDRNNVVSRPIRPDDSRRFRDAYRAYKDNAATPESGTPLKEWPLATASMVEELKYFGFTTVEHVANASDTACGNMAGLRSLKDKAAAYVELAKGNAPLEKLQNQLDEQKSTNEALQAQLVEMNRKLAELSQGAAPAVKAKVAPAAP